MQLQIYASAPRSAKKFDNFEQRSKRFENCFSVRILLAPRTLRNRCSPTNYNGSVTSCYKPLVSYENKQYEDYKRTDFSVYITFW